MHDHRNHRSVQRLLAGLAVPMVLVTVSCGSDTPAATVVEPPTSSASTTADGMPEADGVEAFCDAVIDYDAIDSPGGPEEMTADDLRDYGDAIAPLAETIAAHAPDDAAGAAAEFKAAVDRAREGDLSVSDDPALNAAIAGVEQAVREHCDVAIVDVVGADFEFDVPATVPSGPISFRLVNDGDEFHVLLLVKAPADVNDDVDFLHRFLDAANSGEPSAMAEFEPYNVAGQAPAAAPGDTATAVKVLEPGEYLFFCPIPLDFTDPESHTHIDAGMHGRFTVEA